MEDGAPRARSRRRRRGRGRLGASRGDGPADAPPDHEGVSAPGEGGSGPAGDPGGSGAPEPRGVREAAAPIAPPDLDGPERGAA
jgi:hypothetical protein